MSDNRERDREVYRDKAERACEQLLSTLYAIPPHRKAFARVFLKAFAVERAADPLTLKDLKARLLELRAAGYNFPDYVLKDVEGEIAEASKSA